MTDGLKAGGPKAYASRHGVSEANGTAQACSYLISTLQCNSLQNRLKDQSAKKILALDSSQVLPQSISDFAPCLITWNLSGKQPSDSVRVGFCSGQKILVPDNIDNAAIAHALPQ
jgi:hypothetical protein